MQIFTNDEQSLIHDEQSHAAKFSALLMPPLFIVLRTRSLLLGLEQFAFIFTGWAANYNMIFLNSEIPTTAQSHDQHTQQINHGHKTGHRDLDGGDSGVPPHDRDVWT